MAISKYNYFTIGLPIGKFTIGLPIKSHLRNYKYKKIPKNTFFNSFFLNFLFLCCSVCLFVYTPFCHVSLKVDMSTLFTTFFLWTSLQSLLQGDCGLHTHHLSSAAGRLREGHGSLLSAESGRQEPVHQGADGGVHQCHLTGGVATVGGEWPPGCHGNTSQTTQLVLGQFWFLAHLSTKCSRWAFVMAQCPSSIVYACVRPCINNFFKQHLLWNRLLDFHQTSQEWSLGDPLSKLFKPFQLVA